MSEQKPKITAIIPSAIRKVIRTVSFGIFFILIILVISTRLFATTYTAGDSVKAETEVVQSETVIAPPPALDKEAYDKKILELANIPPPPAPKTPPQTATTTGTTVVAKSATATTQIAQAVPPKPIVQLWPAKTVYPNYGAILPFKRIVAYYGNFYSRGMGVLGQYPTEEMLAKLDFEVKRWEAADPTTPVIPAIDYIAVTAQGTPSVGGKYRLRMPPEQIEKAIALADRVHGIVILEIQCGQSTMETEIPMLEKYLSMPQVHLALDPEFTMIGGARPGTVIGTLDAKTVNWASNYLAGLVKKNNLPPKILLLHRFTRPMITNSKNITPLPEVQIIMDMDGWGSPAKKIGTYKQVIYPEPVQFTGFKLFYKNDLLAPSTRMLTPAEILKLQPIPSFIQYQ